MFDLIIKNCMAVTANGLIPADICVKNEKIAEITPWGRYERADTTLDIQGKYLFPGVVDSHVHFNDPGFPEREDMRSGTMSAAAGGVTTVIDMPLSGNPAIISLAALELKKRAISEKAAVDCALWGGLVDNNIDELVHMSEAGVCAFKAFTCFAGDDFPFVTKELLFIGMQKAARQGMMVGVHCEDEYQIRSSEAAQGAEVRDSIGGFLEAHGPAAEEIAVDMVLELAEKTGAKVHICHASLPSVVEKVYGAKKRGVRVTVETCPHYLMFTEQDLEKQQGVLKCTPPVRTAEDAEGLWEMLLAGKVDSLCSDHSPSTFLQKHPVGGNFRDVWGGISGVQTLFPVLFSHGVLDRGLGVEELCALTSSRPARIFGLWPQKGCIAAGSDADFMVFNPAAKWRITPESLFYKNCHTPYMGRDITGRVDVTFVRGKMVFNKGVITAKCGNFLRPTR